MVIKLDKDGLLHLSKLKNFLDISKVFFYTVSGTRNGCIRVKFYDEKMKLIPLKTKDEIRGKKAKKSKR